MTAPTPRSSAVVGTDAAARHVQPLEHGVVHAVSKVRLDTDGRVIAVLWGQVDTRKNDWANGETTAPVADVVDAIHNGAAVFALFPAEHGHLPERRFVAVEYDNGWESIALDGDVTYEREIHDMDRMQP